MLTPVEKMLFLILAILSLGAAYTGFMQIYAIINRGQGQLHFSGFFRRAWNALIIYISQRTTLKTRRVSSLFHYGIVLGFTYYFLVNLVDGLIGFIPGFEASLNNFGIVYDGYRFIGDILSVVVLVSMSYFLVRRFYLPNKKELQFHDNILLHPKVQQGSIRRDSLIVGGFMLLHIGARFLGESVAVAQHGFDPFMPFASIIAPIWTGLNVDALLMMRHLFWWLALGSIFLFFPYFPFTKHAHLFMAPLNYLTRPERKSLGALEPLNFEDESLEQFGASKLEDLSKTQIFDGLACIMCNRCQDVCPAYVTGKELSPSALEVNKRYYMKDHWNALADGAESEWLLLGNVISESAVWACTSCGACVDICPVGNEPMFDILDIRRDAVLMKSEFPQELQGAFNGMERQGNPWQIAESRLGWTEGLDIPVPTTEENPDFDVLYWTGCAVSYDPRAQKTAQALVKVMHQAGVNFAVLGNSESCTGDVARRAGNEYLYFEMATANVEMLNEVKPKRIVVTCPHCYHNIGKEYPQFGGDYEIVHHTELIEELVQAKKLSGAADPSKWSNVTFHDPCYLGRHNNIVDAPRNVLQSAGASIKEMPRSKKNSFCCGAGGAQFWKEEEHGTKKVNLERYEEAKATGADTLAVGCPFCMRMFVDASGEIADGPKVMDVVEIIAENIGQGVPAGD